MRFVWVLSITFFSIFVFAEEISTFEKIKSLVGEWKKEGSEGNNFYISFQSSANGEKLVDSHKLKKLTKMSIAQRRALPAPQQSAEISH